MTPAAPVVPRPRTINLIVGLIRAFMGLDAEQVVVYNQKWKIPPDGRLYISVGYLGQKPYAPALSYEPTPAGLKEVQTLNSQEIFSINVMSFSQEAVERKDEVIMAFGSTMGQQLCEANALKLGRLPVSFTDLSTLQGTAMLNRFNITMNVLCARTVERMVEYYQEFPTPTLVINP